MNAIDVGSLVLDYGERRALDGVSLSVGRGEIFGLLGPNGGGKTSLFRVLCTLVRPKSGTARVLGLDVTSDAEGVRRCLGVVFQSPALDGKLTAEENLRHHGHLYGLHGADLRQRIAAMLDRVGLAERARERVERLSGGLRRRVELAKGLLHRPEVLLLDEPSTGLDPGARRDLWIWLRAVREREGVTSFLTTHLMEEAERCDRLAILDRGRLVALGTPAELKAEVGGEVITLGGAEPERLRADLQARFGVEATLLDGKVRVEKAGGSAFLRQILEAMPGRVDSFAVGQPTLEDVFIRRTGHRFWREEE